MRRTKPETVAIVDQFIDEHGVDQQFDKWALNNWLRANDHHGDATDMLQIHSKSHQTPTRAKHVLMRAGWGRGAYWYVLNSLGATRALDIITREAADRVDNLLARRPDAITGRDDEVSMTYLMQRTEVTVIVKMLKSNRVA